jgi:ceramide glucosyltransferase
MAYAIRGRTLERFGGFGPLVGHLTDDLAVARVVLASGGRIAQTALPQWVQTTVPDGSRYVRLMHRWFLFASLLLRHQPRHLQIVIAFLYALPPILLWAVVIATVAEGSAVAMATLAVALIVRSLTLVALQRRIYGRSLHRPMLSLASELLQPFHLVHATLVRTIVWRTRRYVVSDIDSFRSA